VMMVMLVPKMDVIMKLDAGTHSLIATIAILAQSIHVIIKLVVPTAVMNVRFLTLATLSPALP